MSTYSSFSSPIPPILTHSSPLNPYKHSSSPITSPTPLYSNSRMIQLTPFTYKTSSPTSSTSSSSTSSPPLPFMLPVKHKTTRYTRPISPRRTSPNLKSQSLASENGIDLFSEGTTPMQGAMWRERFTRRMEERERRKKSREADLDKRRAAVEVGEDEEADRRAQADDEEIFRRLMVLQKRKANHAQLVSHEIETGGSDPYLPDFWEDELSSLEQEERIIISALDEEERQRASSSSSNSISTSTSTTISNFTTPPSHRHSTSQNNPLQGLDQMEGINSHHHDTHLEEEEEMWMAEAEEAEQAERDLEEIEILRQVEEAAMKRSGGSLHVPPTYGGPEGLGVGMGMDVEEWDS